MNSAERRAFTEPAFSIGVAAKKLGLSTHSLRLYEAEGLIIPYKTDTGRRLYSDLEIEKITCIRSMIKEKGLNFEGIRRMLALIPCWKLRGCNKEQIANCDISRLKTRPCWATEEKCCDPFPSCRDCPVYQKLVSCDDIANLIVSSFEK